MAAAEDWELPESIRADLGAWQFDEAREALDDATRSWRTATRSRRPPADLELTPPDTLRAAFEGDGGLPAAAAEADAERDALAELTSASAELDGEPALVESIGLFGTDPEAELADARRVRIRDLEQAGQAAARAAAARDGADDAGRVRVLAVGGAILLLDALFLGLSSAAAAAAQAAFLP